MPTSICSGFEKAEIIPFNTEHLLKRCSGTDGAVEIRQKKTFECIEEMLTDTQDCQSNSLVFLQANVSSDKEYDFYDEDYSCWLECIHPHTLPHNESSAFPSASALVCDDDYDSLVDNHSSSLTPTSSFKSLPATCSNPVKKKFQQQFSHS